MPLPIIDNEDGPDQADMDLRQREIKERLDRARKNETVERMIDRYLDYMQGWDDD